jgi:hypothetical protein
MVASGSHLVVNYVGEHLCCLAELHLCSLNLLNDIHRDSFNSAPSSLSQAHQSSWLFQVISIKEGKSPQWGNHKILEDQIFAVNLLLAFPLLLDTNTLHHSHFVIFWIKKDKTKAHLLREKSNSLVGCIISWALKGSKIVGVIVGFSKSYL